MLKNFVAFLSGCDLGGDVLKKCSFWFDFWRICDNVNVADLMQVRVIIRRSGCFQ